MDNSRSSNEGDRVEDNDLTSRSTDELETQRVREDTAQIFVEFAHLHSHSSSGATTLTNSRPCSDPPTDAARPPASTLLIRSKSREATRKDPHPKAVHSTKPQIVSSHHCVADADSSKAPSPSASKLRPDKLSLGPPKHRRAPSSHSATGSDSSEKTTPAAQDPPMLLSPELSSSYPPVSTSALRELREGLVRSAEHAGVKSTAAVSTSATCTASLERIRQYAHVDGGDSVRARLIADRLKIIGDDLQDDLQNECIMSTIEEFTAAVSDAVINTNSSLQAVVFMYMQSGLSWHKVAALFRFVCTMMEATRADDQFSFFEKAWHCLLDNVVPWIQDRGGWSALQKETEPRLPNTPNVVRRSQLKSAQSEPVLPQSPTSPSFHQSCCADGASNFGGRIPTSASGRTTWTPQMTRHHYHQHQVPLPREQSSPCLPRDRSNSQHSHSESSSSAHQGRSRVWSLTDSGSFKREGDGMEDTEHSISELDMMLNHDEEELETFAASQEDEEEEEEEEGESQRQEAEQTLTASSLKRTFHASASFSNPASPPIVVPSPHSGSQPETMSVDEFPIDSGIDTSSLDLSLSCSPRERNVSFSVGGVGHRSKLNQTSLTSLSSVASASPVHTSPSSRKNSSNGAGSGYFSNTTRGGSLKESSRQKKHNGDSPMCHRTSSLTSRPPRRTTTSRTTNGTPSESVASGHSSWMGTPVRHMSTSASTIFELVKDYFQSP